MADQQIDDNGVQALPGMAPIPGDRYKNRATPLIGTVVAIEQRRQCWVLFRVGDDHRELPLREFLYYWQPV